MVGWFVSQKQPGKRNSKEPHYVLVMHEIIKKKKPTKTFTRHFKTFAKSSTFPRGPGELPLHLGTVSFFFPLTVKLRRKTLLKSK